MMQFAIVLATALAMLIAGGTAHARMDVDADSGERIKDMEYPCRPRRTNPRRLSERGGKGSAVWLGDVQGNRSPRPRNLYQGPAPLPSGISFDRRRIYERRLSRQK